MLTEEQLKEIKERWDSLTVALEHTLSLFGTKIRYAVEVGPFACNYNQTLMEVKSTIGTLICVMPEDKEVLRNLIKQVGSLKTGQEVYQKLNIPNMCTHYARILVRAYTPLKNCGSCGEIDKPEWPNCSIVDKIVGPLSKEKIECCEKWYPTKEDSEQIKEIIAKRISCLPTDINTLLAHIEHQQRALEWLAEKCDGHTLCPAEINIMPHESCNFEECRVAQGKAEYA